jgi:hypothetical protein
MVLAWEPLLFCGITRLESVGAATLLTLSAHTPVCYKMPAARHFALTGALLSCLANEFEIKITIHLASSMNFFPVPGCAQGSAG